MKRIFLTQGKTTLVDDEDFIKFNVYKWYAQEVKNGKFYAYRRFNKTSISLHRNIFLELLKPGFIVDHIDHNGLNNQRFNLRICSLTQNNRNRDGASKNSKSGLRGVHWNKKHRNWYSSIRVDGKFIHLGVFTDKFDAAKAYAEANKKYFGDFGGNL